MAAVTTAPTAVAAQALAPVRRAVPVAPQPMALPNRRPKEK